MDMLEAHRYPKGYPRSGMVDMSPQLIERADESVNVFRIVVADALRESGLEDGEPYYVRVQVIELPPLDGEA